MATIKELIRTEAAGGISFGNYELDTKTKLSDYEYDGDSVSYTHLTLPTTPYV